MAEPHPFEPLKPGDPPPFWDGPWHPQGLAEGAILVKPRVYGEGGGTALAAAPVQEATARVPAAPDAPQPVMAPPSELAAEAAAGGREAESPRADAPPFGGQVAPPPPGAPAAEPPRPQPPPTTQPRSLVLTLLAQGPAETAPTLPAAVDVLRSDAFRDKARELQAQGHLGHALAALAEALKLHAADAKTYAQIGHVLMAARAPEDAAHHFLLSYMLSPKEPQVARLTIHASWALGYVGWAFQIAQALYKQQPSQDWVEMGRAAMAWLKSDRPAAYTLLCTGCRLMTIHPTAGPCPRCQAPVMAAPANDVGFIGLRLMQQNAPTGRLFVGCQCCGCFNETVILVKPGGTRCPYCKGSPLQAVQA